MNNIENLFVDTIKYDGFDFYNYFLPAATINETVERRNITAIRLQEAAKGRPTVAIALGRDTHPDRAEADYSLTQWVVESALRANLWPVFISYDKVYEQLSHWNPQGIILPGGSYHVPNKLVASKKFTIAKKNLKRFKANDAMLKYAIKNKLPTLGLCAGMQVIGGHLGGKLAKVSNLALDTQINHNSKKTMHSVIVSPDTELHKITGILQFESNSFHISALHPDYSKNFNIIAKSDDGIIEAIEPKNKWNQFVMATQWHAEKMAVLGDEKHPDVLIFQAFANAIRENL
jgi:putative glutamine amidotransferase